MSHHRIAAVFMCGLLTLMPFLAYAGDTPSKQRSVESLPLECAVLLTPQWAVELSVVTIKDSTTELGSGFAVSLVSKAGCKMTLFFLTTLAPIYVGDRFRLTGTTQNGSVSLEDVERLPST